MAITAFAPVVTRSRELIAEKTNQVALKIVTSNTEVKQADRKFFALFITAVGIFGFVLLLVINTFLAQDAFELSKLKAESRLISDKREAIDRSIDQISSPISLASAATKLGMRPSDAPIFLNLDAIPTAKGVIKNG